MSELELGEPLTIAAGSKADRLFTLDRKAAAYERRPAALPGRGERQADLL